MNSNNTAESGTGKKIHNFNAGPSILPQEVFQEAAAAILNFNNSGLSILSAAVGVY